MEEKDKPADVRYIKRESLGNAACACLEPVRGALREPPGSPGRQRFSQAVLPVEARRSFWRLERLRSAVTVPTARCRVQGGRFRNKNGSIRNRRCTSCNRWLFVKAVLGSCSTTSGALPMWRAGLGSPSSPLPSSCAPPRSQSH